jgi:hypothetical protein
MNFVALGARSIRARGRNHLKNACPALKGEKPNTDERDAIPEVFSRPSNDAKTFGMTQLSLFSGFNVSVGNYKLKSKKRLRPLE